MTLRELLKAKYSWLTSFVNKVSIFVKFQLVVRYLYSVTPSIKRSGMTIGAFLKSVSISFVFYTFKASPCTSY